jgi:hypothetical protein
VTEIAGLADTFWKAARKRRQMGENVRMTDKRGTRVRSGWVGAMVLGGVVLGCGSGSGPGGPTQVSATRTTTFSTKVNTRLDLLFVIDDQSSTGVIQQKFYDQLPNFVTVLENQPNPLDLHVAVVTTDMGASGDSTRSIGCTSRGNQGQFQSAPTGSCTNTGIQSGATYLSIEGGYPNFTGDLGTALQCISLVGQKGCGFGQPLAALDRALGADGSAPPSTNASFLRDDAYLGIVLLSNEDDCSAPPNTQLFSLNVGGSNQQNIANALGPVANYRCSEYGHLCQDPSGNTIMPPLNPPGGATTLDLTNCTSNDTGTGLLTPVSQFVDDIKSLKVDPDNQIVVSAIVAPSSPYTVAWVAPLDGQNLQPGELWPEVEHSCGAAGGDDVNPEATQLPNDGSSGDPAVRISQFVNSFSNSALRSVCDASYASAMAAIATKVGAPPSPPCMAGTIQETAQGVPDCAVTAHLVENGVYSDKSYESCALTGNAPPCWISAPGGPTCDGTTFSFVETTPSNSVTVTCAVCEPGIPAPGCPS